MSSTCATLYDLIWKICQINVKYSCLLKAILLSSWLGTRHIHSQVLAFLLTFVCVFQHHILQLYLYNGSVTLLMEEVFLRTISCINSDEAYVTYKFFRGRLKESRIIFEIPVPLYKQFYLIDWFKVDYAFILSNLQKRI